MKNKLGKWIILTCKIHTMKEEAFGGSPKGELGEGKWVSLNTLSLKKIKIWQDYFISLQIKKGEERVFLCW